MLTEGWGRVGRDSSGGYYVGTAVPTGEPVRARFAHFWRVEGDRITSVLQVTDSATWEHALTNG